jgi:hypothetical protein
MQVNVKLTIDECAATLARDDYNIVPGIRDTNSFPKNPAGVNAPARGEASTPATASSDDSTVNL